MSQSLEFEKTHRFSKLILDYIAQKQELSSFYNRFPIVENFKDQIKEKLENYNSEYRLTLVDVLNSQYDKYAVSNATKLNINLLKESNTFTITTGHQLNLFTGPLYTFYKIISVLNTCKELKTNYPEYNFVPIFWLASEDHDFDEINFFNCQNTKIEWDVESNGAVGEKPLHNLDNPLNIFKSQLPKSPFSDEILSLFKEAYLNHETLSEASIYLYNKLFGEFGLVVLEPNVKALKSLFKPYIGKEILEEVTYKKVHTQAKALKSFGYHEQVTPRDINFFYKTTGLRERIVKKGDNYFVNNTTLEFTKAEMIDEIELHPERFSPNALLRPLYQEVILPNLSYIGGGGELAYWFELKTTFKAFNITFPSLQLRNSVLLFTQKTKRKIEKMDLCLEDVFLNSQDLKNKYVKKASEINIDFSKQKQHLSLQFKDLYDLAKKTDKSFLGAVAAQEKKQHNGLDKLEKRLLRAQRRKMSDDLQRLEALQLSLFPKQNLQERVSNFTEYYTIYGKSFTHFLVENLHPFDYRFLLLQLKS
jgi:bacillithiol biosynthesis cysteine-adding enzyme BshC